MENLEEVLQALDDFQKMRPTEIPRELEDYLCWVAKTGDPVYQWPMIKTLFREKLTRVMTDFYESCPTLELAPCSNVEHFNYDTMKSNLLERLESFANAPFTVQRICELLTEPRKEYNRIDKFMRAIEKNILVVSTREPGSITRRGEMGDGMVNGSVEEETASITQQSLQPPPLSQSLQQSQPAVQLVQSTPQDVEMEYWEKDCGTTIPVGMHNVGNEPSSLHTAITSASTLPGKNVYTVDEAIQEKFERTRADVTSSNLISATSDFSTISNLTSQIQSHESLQPVSVVSVVQNPPTCVRMPPSSDLSIGSADVMETIVTENIDSQTSLDMDNGKNEVTIASTTISMTTATTTTMSTSVPITVTTTTATAATMATMMMATTTTTIMMTGTTTIMAPTTTTTTTIAEAAAETTTATTTMTMTTTTSTPMATMTLTSIPSAMDSINKLQTIIQDEDFKSGDNDNNFELYIDKSNKSLKAASTIVNTEEGVIHSTKSGEIIESNSNCNNTKESMLNENLLNTNNEVKSDVLSNNIETLINKNITNKSDKETTLNSENIDRANLCLKDDESSKTTVFIESQTIEKNNTVPFDKCVSAVIVSSDEALHELEKSKIQFKNLSMTISSKDNSIHEQSVAQQQTKSTELIDTVLQSTTRAIPFKSDDNRQTVQNPEFHEDNLKNVEVFNDKPSLVESIIPVPITNENNPKETTLVIDTTTSSAIETTGDSNISNVSCQFSKDDKLISIEHDTAENMQQDNKLISCKVKGNETSVIESITCESTHELMEIDEGGPLPTFQHDELMEPETMEELSKS